MLSTVGRACRSCRRGAGGCRLGHAEADQIYCGLLRWREAQEARESLELIEEHRNSGQLARRPTAPFCGRTAKVPLGPVPGTGGSLLGVSKDQGLQAARGCLRLQHSHPALAWGAPPLLQAAIAAPVDSRATLPWHRPACVAGGHGCPSACVRRLQGGVRGVSLQTAQSPVDCELFCPGTACLALGTAVVCGVAHTLLCVACTIKHSNLYETDATGTARGADSATLRGPVSLRSYPLHRTRVIPASGSGVCPCAAGDSARVRFSGQDQRPRGCSRSRSCPASAWSGPASTHRHRLPAPARAASCGPCRPG